jgi:hypothetical protein
MIVARTPRMNNIKNDRTNTNQQSTGTCNKQKPTTMNQQSTINNQHATIISNNNNLTLKEIGTTKTPSNTDTGQICISVVKKAMLGAYHL